MSTKIFIIRLKSSLANGLNEIFALTAKEAFRNKLKKKTMIEMKKSPLGRKIDIAKAYYLIEMAPPKFSEIKQFRDDLVSIKTFFKNGTFKNVTVKDAWLFLLVCIEVRLWFFVGEVIGKRHIVGYKV